MESRERSDVDTAWGMVVVFRGEASSKSSLLSGNASISAQTCIRMYPPHSEDVNLVQFSHSWYWNSFWQFVHLCFVECWHDVWTNPTTWWSMTSAHVRYFAGEDGHRFRYRSTLAPGPTVRVGQFATESNDICCLGRQDWNGKVMRKTICKYRERSRKIWRIYCNVW